MSKPVAIFARFCSVTLRRPDSMEARYVRSMPILRAKRSWLEPFLARSSLILSPTCIWRRFCIPEDYFDVVYITTDYIQHFKLIETDEEPFLARSSLILSPTCIWRRFCIPEDYFDVVYITTDYIQHFKLIETDESGCFFLALCQTKHEGSLADRCLDAKRPFVLRLM